MSRDGTMPKNLEYLHSLPKSQRWKEAMRIARSRPRSEETKRRIGIANSKEWIPKRCKQCASFFSVTPAREKTAKYCSQKCLGQANAHMHRGESNVNWKGGAPKCLKCEVSISREATLCWACFRRQNVGPNHHNWKGGTSSESERIRKSIEYRLWREAIFSRDNFTCQFCGSRGGKLNADHIKPFSLFPELRLALDNGRTLCFPCHKGTPTWGGRVKKTIETPIKDII